MLLEVGNQICPVQNPLDLEKSLTYKMHFFTVIAAWKSCSILRVESYSVPLTVKGGARKEPLRFEHSSCLRAASDPGVMPV